MGIELATLSITTLSSASEEMPFPTVVLVCDTACVISG